MRAALPIVVLSAAACAAPSDGPAARPFRECAREVGLDFVHVNGMSGERYIVEVIGGGGAFVDYDDDGDLDVYLVQGNRLGPGEPEGALGDRLFRNDLHVSPDGPRVLHFTDVTAESGIEPGGYGMGVIAGDYDNDGRVDLYVTRFGSNRLLHNDGDGRFSDVTAASGADDVRWSVSAAFVDYDRDGWLDLYVANYVDFRYATHKQCLPEQGFVDYCSPLAYRPEPDRLLRNRGDGTFEDVTAAAGIRARFGNGLGVVPGDFNGDGWEDIYVANDWSENQLWTNRGDGTFEDRALEAGCAVNAAGRPEASMGIVAGDFDDDGDEDLFMTHLMGETNTIYRNGGDGTFEDDSIGSGLGAPSWDFTGFGTVGLDYDGDGRLDLYVANGAVRLIMALVQQNDPFPLHQPNQLFRNVGNGSFVDVSAEMHVDRNSEVSRGVAVGDVDNDGDPDLLVMNNNGPVRLLLNEISRPRWIGLRLVDRHGRDGLGSRVRLSAESSTRWSRVQTAGSYASSSDPRLSFALTAGADPNVHVRWPSGRIEQWRSPPTGRYTTLHEGSGEELN